VHSLKRVVTRVCCSTIRPQYVRVVCLMCCMCMTLVFRLASTCCVFIFHLRETYQMIRLGTICPRITSRGRGGGSPPPQRGTPSANRTPVPPLRRKPIPFRVCLSTFMCPFLLTPFNKKRTEGMVPSVRFPARRISLMVTLFSLGSDSSLSCYCARCL